MHRLLLASVQREVVTEIFSKLKLYMTVHIMCTNTKNSSLYPAHIRSRAETNCFRSCVDVQCCEFIANIAIVNKRQFALHVHLLN